VKQVTLKPRKFGYRNASLVMEGSMSSSKGQNAQSRGSNGRAIVATLLVQVLVLAAVSVAAVYYVNWSSQAALAEFVGAVKPSVPDHARRFSSPIQPVKGQMSCARRA
jgi:hypothetical protein